MLTKDDLKEIRKVIREEVSVESDDLKSDIKFSLLRIRTEIQHLEDRIKNLEIRVTKIEKRMIKLQVRFDERFDYLDKEHLKNLEKIERIERHLVLTPVS